MGMRTTQIRGLHPRAKALVKGKLVLAYTEQVVRIYPDDRREEMPDQPVMASTIQKEKSGETFIGMFDEDYPLHKYTFPDGTVYYEEVQATPWSSGPCYFLALQDEDREWVPESKWTNDEIQQGL